MSKAAGFVLVTIVTCVLLLASESKATPGGYSKTKKATVAVQHLVDQIKCQLEAMVAKKYSTFQAIAYKSQVVAGTNYLVKVFVGCKDYVHVKIFKPLPNRGKVVLIAYELNKKKDDPINDIHNIFSK